MPDTPATGTELLGLFLLLPPSLVLLSRKKKRTRGLTSAGTDGPNNETALEMATKPKERPSSPTQEVRLRGPSPLSRKFGKSPSRPSEPFRWPDARVSGIFVLQPGKGWASSFGCQSSDPTGHWIAPAKVAIYGCSLKPPLLEVQKVKWRKPTRIHARESAGTWMCGQHIRAATHLQAAESSQRAAKCRQAEIGGGYYFIVKTPWFI